jgi:hypothetical protein
MADTLGSLGATAKFDYQLPVDSIKSQFISAM